MVLTVTLTAGLAADSTKKGGRELLLGWRSMAPAFH